MTARVTTDTHLRRGRSRAQMITGAPLLENTASIITVEPNQQTRNTFPVEARHHVIFSVSLGAYGIWRIERFNSAFVVIFGASQRSGGNGSPYTLPLAFATKLAGALSQCVENGGPVGLGVAFQILGYVPGLVISDEVAARGLAEADASHLCHELIHVLTRLHRIPPPAVGRPLAFSDGHTAEHPLIAIQLSLLP